MFSLAFSQRLLHHRLTPVSLGLLMVNGLVFAPIAAVAGNWNQFDVCVTEMQRNGVSNDAAAAGCSEAIIPKEMSECVSRISGNTDITGNIALQACFQVRRPVDLSHCVVDINNGALKGYRPATAVKAETPEDSSAATPDSQDSTTADSQTQTPPPAIDPTQTDGLSALKSGDLTLAALQSCRQSLLPGRHSECVIALSRDITNFTPAKAMTTCLAAEDFPRDLFPAYNQTQN
ncbi:MAG: hypothetical protein VKL20_07390 [Synechocystis sp.]|nr:hypothetical protein [Synechocystis sp.]